MATVNGRAVEFAALVMPMAGATIETLEDASYGSGREVQIHHATNGSPLDYSLGAYKDKPFEATFAKSDIKDFLNGVEDAIGGGKLGGRFTTTVSYADTDQDVEEDSLDLILEDIDDTIKRGDGRIMVKVTAKQIAPLAYQGFEMMPAANAGSGGAGGGRGPGGFPLGPPPGR